MTHARARTTASLLGLLLLAAPAAASAAERGTWWEMTTEMEMVGMPFAMPATTFKLCQPDGDWKRPPEGKDDRRCQMKDVRTSGKTMTWKMVCTGEEPMEGEGEMTRTADTFTGRTHIKSAQGEMNMKMRGKKVGGACDPEELRRSAERQVEQYRAQGKAAQAQAEAAGAQRCEESVRAMQASAIAGSYPLCKDPARKKEFCARARTEEGYGLLLAQARAEEASKGMVPGPKAVASACDLDLDAEKRALCAGAAKKESLDFLAAFCPAEARVVARRECAGRDYTAMMNSRYRGFCSRLAGERLDADAQGDGQEATPGKKKAPKEDAVDKGKKLLKGVLGF